MSFTIKHNIPTKKSFEEWEVHEFTGTFHIKITKKNIFNLAFKFRICYEWSNGFYDNYCIKDSIIFSYDTKENTMNILDNLCAGYYENELTEKFKNQWINGIKINSIIENVVRQLDIWK